MSSVSVYAEDVPHGADEHAAVQYIDARDLARFAIGLVEQRVVGTFNVSAVAPPFGFGQLLAETARDVLAGLA